MFQAYPLLSSSRFNSSEPSHFSRASAVLSAICRHPFQSSRFLNLWRSEEPARAWRGVRKYSMDGYEDTIDLMMTEWKPQLLTFLSATTTLLSCSVPWRNVGTSWHSWHTIRKLDDEWKTSIADVCVSYDYVWFLLLSFLLHDVLLGQQTIP